MPKGVWLKMSEHRQLHCCSFCNKSIDKVKKLIFLAQDIYICDDCVLCCVELLVKEKVLEGTIRRKLNNIETKKG